MNWNFLNTFLLYISVQFTAPEKTVGQLACEGTPLILFLENKTPHWSLLKHKEKIFTYPRVTQTGIDEFMKQTFNIACTCIFFDKLVLDS